MAPIFLLDKRMLVVETSPGFYVCFRCGIVVLQAVKKLLVVHYFGACLLRRSVAYHGNCLAIRSCREISLSFSDADQLLVCVFQRLVVMTIISYRRMNVPFTAICR